MSNNETLETTKYTKSIDKTSTQLAFIHAILNFAHDLCDTANVWLLDLNSAKTTTKTIIVYYEAIKQSLNIGSSKIPQSLETFLLAQPYMLKANYIMAYKSITVSKQISYDVIV